MSIMKNNLLAKMAGYPTFYKKVWLACLEIPRGQVRTYKWVANKVGSPLSSRAVGNALKMNPFPPKVPCHRVICSNGKLGGYSGSGGITKKIALLRREGNKGF